MKNFEDIKNKNGNNNLIKDDNVFNRDNMMKESCRWKFEERKCRAFGIVDESDSFILLRPQYHEGSSKIVGKLKAIEDIKRCADVTNWKCENCY